MNESALEATERLIRVRAERRGNHVEVRVHYSAYSENGCTVYSILGVDDAD